MTPQELARETRSSIELTRNSKGDYQWVIKQYHENGGEDDAIKVLYAIDVRLRQHFLRASDAD